METTTQMQITLLTGKAMLFVNSNEQDRQPDSGLRRSLGAWLLWVLVSAIGGAIGGSISEPLEIVGFLFLPGAILGAAQALVLGRYLRDLGGTADTRVFWLSLWFSASFLGWFAGCLVWALINVLTYYLTGVPEFAQQIGSAIIRLVGTEGARTTFPLYSLVWAVFATFQGAALVGVSLSIGHRELLPLAALWVLADAIGGVLGVAADLVINARVFPGESLFRIVEPVVGFATAGALYGAATGVVLAMIVRRSASS